MVLDMFPFVLGRWNGIKYPRPVSFLLTLYLCVVGRFACQVPILSPTRTAIPERFFGRKITIGNFLSRKPEARTRRYSPSELSSPGDLSSEAGLMMPFHRKIWKRNCILKSYADIGQRIQIKRVPLSCYEQDLQYLLR